MDRTRQKSRRRKHVTLAAIALTAVLAVIAVGIILTHNDSVAQVEANFKARAASSAEGISSFVAQQSERETLTAEKFLAGNRDLGPEFRRTAATFGSPAAVLLDGSGRVLQVVPNDPALIGKRIAPRYSHLTAAEHGSSAVSGVVPSAARHEPVIAIAVPFQTRQGRRVFSAAYPVAKTALAAFVKHVVATTPHLVLLLDAAGNVISANPTTSAKSLRARAPALASALARRDKGHVTLGGQPSTFISAPVSGTSWRILIAVPNSKLFASVSGPAQWLPWVVFVLIALLAGIVVGLLSRSLLAQDRQEELSEKLAHAARVDALTELSNRRDLQERIPQIAAYAHRHHESLAVLMIDFDHFKTVNDTYGHDTGDALLRAVADCMRDIFRRSDLFGRWGGDEFLAVLASTDHERACIAADRLCAKVADIDLAPHGLSHPLTLSVGCAAAIGASVADLISRADAALYEAKRGGRAGVAL
jgi:diguanylate cyclase (GGDEF)-like protein